MVIIETWRPVLGFEGLYEVSDLGRVRSLPGGHRKGIVLAAKMPSDPRQYAGVWLHQGGKRFRRHIHVLVAEAFLPPRPSPKHQVRHFNGDRTQNYADNFLWGTSRDNAADRARHGRTVSGPDHGKYGRGLFGSSNGAAVLTERRQHGRI